MAVYPPWSDLPQELLSAIATYLHSSPIDMLRFRNVCKSWRSSSFLPPPKLFYPLPLTTPSPPYITSYNNSCKPRSFKTCLLSATAVYTLRSRIMPYHSSSRGFLLFVDQSTPGKVSLRQPFDVRKYHLPVTFPRKIDLVSLHASELGRFYNLALPKGWYLTDDDEIDHWSGVVQKVVLFSSNASDDSGGLFVVVLYEEGQLGLLRLSVNDDQKNVHVGAVTKWKIIHYGKGFHFDDIVDFKGRVLGVDRRGRVYNIDLGSSSSSTMINVIVPAIFGGGGRRKRLVESLGRLHLVVRTNARDRTSALFKVYQLCEDTKNWVEVSSLGDQTFFVGLDFSFSASADQLHGSYGKNWILYKEKSFLNYDGKDDDDELFRSLEYDQLRIGVWRLEDAAHLSVIGSYPEYANVFWPPPIWLSQSKNIDQSDSFDSLLTELDLFRKKIRDGKTKVRFEELSKFHKKGAVALVMHSRKIKELLNRVRHINEKMEENKMIDVPLQQHCSPKNLHNQVRTSTLESEDQRQPTDSLQQAITQFQDSLQRSTQQFNNSDFDWYKMGWNVNECILQFEKTVVFFENALMKSYIARKW